MEQITGTRLSTLGECFPVHIQILELVLREVLEVVHTRVISGVSTRMFNRSSTKSSTRNSTRSSSSSPKRAELHTTLKMMIIFRFSKIEWPPSGLKMTIFGLLHFS